MNQPESEIDRPVTGGAEAIFEERRTSRGGFLRTLGLTLAVGVGSGLALARPAWAQNAHCCQDSTCNLPGCASQNKYRCYDCDGRDCCQCLNFNGDQCRFHLGCGGCP